MKKFIEFVSGYPTRHYSKGEVILHQDVVPAYCYIVKTGLVKTYELTHGGEEKPLLFDGPGEIFPIAWLFDHIKRSMYFYEAFTDCRVHMVPREDIREFFLSNAASQLAVFEHFVSRYQQFQTRILGLEQNKAAHKVLYTLKFLADRFGSQVNSKHVRLRLPLTQQDLANFIGLTRETTSIELKRLQQRGVVRSTPLGYIVNCPKLEALLQEI